MSRIYGEALGEEALYRGKDSVTNMYTIAEKLTQAGNVVKP